MRGTMAVVLGAGVLAATASGAAPPGRPDLALCPALEPLDEPLNDRTTPLPVPEAFAMLISADRDRFAVATIYGGTTCIDTRPMTTADGFTISADRRFVEFDWSGYEADGHIVVDRTGSGQVIETGASPVSSPSGRLFAAVQQSEAAFGGLEGFGVWRIDVVGVRQLTLQQDIPAMADWRIDGWVGENCIDLSGIAHGKLRRERFVAAPAGDAWRLTPSGLGCAGSKARASATARSPVSSRRR